MPISAGALSAFANPEVDPAAEEEPAPEETEEGGPGKFGMLITLLEQHAEDVMALTDEFDPDQLVDAAQELDEAEQDQLREGASGLEEELVAEMKTALPGATIDETREVAMHLESEGIIDDAERLAGWLFRVGEVGLGEAEAEEGDGEEEDLEEDPEEGGELDFGDEEY
jgi:hypothetical protein